MQDNQKQAVLYAYFAGLLDGEGSIRIAVDRRTWREGKPIWNYAYQGAISIGMTDKEVITLFRDTFMPNTAVHIERVPNRKIVYRCSTSGRLNIISILEKLMPYLKVKKPQAELVMKFCKEKLIAGLRRNKKLPIKELRRRQELYLQVKKLNAVGAVATT